MILITHDVTQAEGSRRRDATYSQTTDFDCQDSSGRSFHLAAYVPRSEVAGYIYCAQQARRGLKAHGYEVEGP